MARVLVTGGAGFIGSHIVDALVAQGHSVSIVDNLSTGSFANLNGHATFYNFDVQDKKLTAVFEKELPEYVFHLAAQTNLRASFKDAMLDGNSNIISTLNVLDNCVKFKAKKIIFSSTAAVYGDVPIDQLPIKEDTPLQPKSPYSIAKVSSEEYIRLFTKEYGLKHTIFRYANVYGPRQSPDFDAGVITVFIDRVFKGMKLRLYGTETNSPRRDFVSIKDVVAANIAAIEKGDNETMNVSSNTETSVVEAFNLIKKFSGVQIDYWFDPDAPCGIMRSRLDNTKAKQILGLTLSFPVAEGIQEQIAFVRQRPLNAKVWLVAACWGTADHTAVLARSLHGITENIVMVDDNSPDNTSETALAHLRGHLIKHPINFGQGAAIQTGMEYALKHGAEVIVHFDGDGQMQIKDIAPMVEPILRGEVEVTFGSRFLGDDRQVPWSKKWFILKPAIWVNWIVTGMKMTDAHCGYRAFSADAARKCSFTQNCRAHATEILELVKQHKLRYKEVPVDILYFRYGQGIGKSIEILRDLFKAKLLK